MNQAAQRWLVLSAAIAISACGSDHGHGDHGHDDHGHEDGDHEDGDHDDHDHDDHDHDDHDHDDHDHDDHDHEANAKHVASGGITFSKEAQASVPFRTELAEKRALAQRLELPAVAESAGGTMLGISAPTGGRFYFQEDEPLVEGRILEAGEVVGRIVPTVAGDDFSKLLFEAEEARLEEARLRDELERILPLIEKGLLPERRKIDLEAELAAVRARRASAESRVASVVDPSEAGGVPLTAIRGGMINEVLVSNGFPVEPGQLIARLGDESKLWFRARFVPDGREGERIAVPVAVRIPNGDELPLSASSFLSRRPVVDPDTHVATWVAEASIQGDKDLAEVGLIQGTPVTLLVKVGEEEETLAVPREAIEEINTYPNVFVQLDGETFDRRRVKVGRIDGPWAEVLSGVEPGERVVTEGGFDVYLSTVVGAVESHRH